MTERSSSSCCILCHSPTREEAIKLLQIHERARQGRLRAKLMRDIRSSEKQSEQKKSKETAEAQDSSVNLVTAAVRCEPAGDQETYSLPSGSRSCGEATSPESTHSGREKRS